MKRLLTNSKHDIEWTDRCIGILHKHNEKERIPALKYFTKVSGNGWDNALSFERIGVLTTQPKQQALRT
jgi:hypothetical protein